MRIFGPRPENALENECAACKKQFKTGDYTTLVVLGPGDNPESQKKAKEGLPYNAIATEVHAACAGVE